MKRSSDMATNSTPKPTAVVPLADMRAASLRQTKPNGRSGVGTAESSSFCGFLSGPQRDLATLQTRPTEELLWTSKIRTSNGGFWRTNRSYRFSLPIWQKRNRDFWTDYRKYS